MTWVDVTSIVLDVVTLILIVRATREIKNILGEARHERLDINRRIEVLNRRVDKREAAEAAREAEKAA